MTKKHRKRRGEPSAPEGANGLVRPNDARGSTVAEEPAARSQAPVDPGAAPADASRWVVLALIAAAYAFGVLVRFEHLGAQLADAQAHIAGTPLPTSLDSYYFGAGIQHLLTGMHAGDPYVPTAFASGQVAVGAAVATLFGLSIDQVMAYLPIFLGPLIVVPVVLIGRLLGSTSWGFVAALAAGLGFSYYGRTSLGYFDTDWAAVTGTFAAATAMVAFLLHMRWASALVAVALVGLTPWFHPGSAHVMLGEVLALALYVLIWQRRAPRHWVFVVALFAASAPLPPLLRPFCGAAVIAVGPWLARQPRLLAGLALALVITFVAAGGLRGPLAAMSDMVLSDQDNPKALVDFVDVSESVGELQAVSVSATAERLAGSLPMLFIGLAGLAVVARRAALMPFLPLAGLGLVLGFTSGARFTIFAVPLVALGAVGLGFTLGRHVARRHRLGARVGVGLGLALSCPVVIAALLSAFGHHRPPAVMAVEIEAMRELGKRVEPGDFAIAWWDYGYALRYAAGTRTLVDGGRHGADTFIVAEALAGGSQLRAANLARAAVETRKRMSVASRPTIHRMLSDHLARKIGPPAELLVQLGTRAFIPPTKTCEIYFVLPRRVLLFASVMNEVRRARGLGSDVGLPELVAHGRRGGGTRVQLSDGWLLDFEHREVQRGPERLPIERLDRIASLPAGKRQVDSSPGHGHGVRVIWLADSDEIIVLGHTLAESVFVQLLLYDRFDPTLFEPVQSGPAGAVFRLSGR